MPPPTGDNDMTKYVEPTEDGAVVRYTVEGETRTVVRRDFAVARPWINDNGYRLPWNEIEDLADPGSLEVATGWEPVAEQWEPPPEPPPGVRWVVFEKDGCAPYFARRSVGAPTTWQVGNKWPSWTAIAAHLEGWSLTLGPEQ